jgi:hypothetical protein
MVSVYLILLFYIILSFLLSYLGNKVAGYNYSIGFIVGIVFSIILWIVWGKSNASY